MVKTFKVGEMLNKRSPFSKTWINFDGSFTEEVYQNQVHFEDEAGNMHNISTDLYDEADLFDYHGPVEVNGRYLLASAKERSLKDVENNKLNRDNYDYQGLSVPFKVQIPREFSRGYLVGRGDDYLKLTPIGASPSRAYIDSTIKNRAHYQDAWNDTDVLLDLTESGVKETIILKTDKAPTKFRFNVEGSLGDDLTTGSLKLQPAWLQDDSGKHRDVEQNIIREEGNVYIELSADVSGLIYPVEIDPTVVVRPSSTDGQDTYVDSNYPTTNYSDSKIMSTQVGSKENSGGDKHAFIKFALPSLPSNIEILSAKASLFSFQASDSSKRAFEILAVTSDWYESSVTWEKQPTTEVTGIKQIFNTYENGMFKDFDITALVRRWVTGSLVNNGFKLRQTLDDGSTGKYVDFNTSEDTSTYSQNPMFSIEYNRVPTAPSLTVPNGGETWNSSHTIEWLPSTDLSDPNIFELLPMNATTAYTGAQSRIGQVFKMPDFGSITKIGMYVYNTDSYEEKLKFELVGIDPATRLPNTTVYSSVPVTIPKQTTGYTFVGADLPTPVYIPKGTLLAIQVAGRATDGFTISCVFNGLYTDGEMYVDNKPNAYANQDLAIKFWYDAATPQNKLKYQIQLSKNNGLTWRNLVSLTKEGATSYEYDFINETESALCKIRVRAYDGSTYSNWDMSDNVFTIIHNVAPTIPTNLNPNGGAISKDELNTFSWKHNDANTNDPQSQFDFQWRVKGNEDWNNVTIATTDNFYNVPAETFPVAQIEWRVRTYDQLGLSSPFSSIATVSAAIRPAPPTITYPLANDIVVLANPTIQWSHPTQLAYWIRVTDENNTVVFEEQRNSPNKAATVSAHLANNTRHTVEVSVRDSTGLWSNFAISPFLVSYTPPLKPKLTINADNINGYVSINIKNPAPLGLIPAITHAEIYRNDGYQGWVLLDGAFLTTTPYSDGEDSGTEGTYIDYTPRSGVDIQYYVRVIGDNTAFMDSDIVTVSAKLKNVQLSLASDPTYHVTLTKRAASSETSTRSSVSNAFSGRSYAMTEFGENYDRNFEYSYKVGRYEDVVRMRDLIEAGEILLLRDNFGKKEYVTIDSLKVEETRIFWNLSFNPLKVYYVEGILI
ncbi:hypothetical protein COO03_11675 [Bacillus sp. AFS098217]|uniref:DNRLRE domain-containing protein n=1 Tax=unclassified Bacillus (in: firmicutes) TaxID=185979 RepID=UPI000BEC9B58|nr:MULTISPECIES: DNRLRE domain-containing protein [unclassified Bacillus (in: firmicutes)]PEB52441.1 hypothetical protein COO03_11675 [Bacillus sp. AFS098217]PEU16774.1 hypothetical protein CN524_03340 [Bacillus sp. AFS019443]PEU20336.1 hypothetical protein CN525_04440 [Bacillus sp. AFS014408]